MNNDNQILDNQTIFFQGVVEARNDPLKLGRVKVRIIGYHTDNLELLSADDLPWAPILIPAPFSGPGTKGMSSSGIPPGTHVFGMFLDGANRQLPLVLGSIKGFSSQSEISPDRAWSSSTEENYTPKEPEPNIPIPNNTGSKQTSAVDTTPSQEGEGDVFEQTLTELGVDFRKGFFDPHEEPLGGYPRPRRLRKSNQHTLVTKRTNGTEPENANDTYRLSNPDKNEQEKIPNDEEDVIESNIETEKIKNQIVSLRTARDRSKEEDEFIWDEPITEKNTDYPYNNICESESGIGTEIDDTPYNERYQHFFYPGTNYHTWATKEGKEVKRVWGSSVKVQHSERDQTYIWGQKVETIQGNVNEQLGKSRTSEVFDTDTNISYGSNKKRIYGQHNESVGSNYVLMVNHNGKQNFNNKLDLDVGAEFKQVTHANKHSVIWGSDYKWVDTESHLLVQRNHYEKFNACHHSTIYDTKKEVISTGDKHITIAKNYYVLSGVIGGNYNFRVAEGNSFVQIGRNTHFIANDSFSRTANTHISESQEFKSIDSNRHQRISSNSIESIGSEKSAIIGATNKLLTRGNYFNISESSSTFITDQDINFQIGDTWYERIKNLKIIEIGKDFFLKCKDGLIEATKFYFKTTSFIIKTEVFKLIADFPKVIMRTGGAFYSKGDITGNIANNASFVFSGDLGIEVKGTLRLKIGSDMIIFSEGLGVLGTGGEFKVGSNEKLSLISPKFEIQQEDFPAPTITVIAPVIEETEEIPTFPQFSIASTSFPEPIAPTSPYPPTDPILPKIPIKATLINNRETWDHEDKLNGDD